MYSLRCSAASPASTDAGHCATKRLSTNEISGVVSGLPIGPLEFPALVMGKCDSGTSAIEARLVSPCASTFAMTRVPAFVHADRPLELELASVGPPRCGVHSQLDLRPRLPGDCCRSARSASRSFFLTCHCAPLWRRLDRPRSCSPLGLGRRSLSHAGVSAPCGAAPALRLPPRDSTSGLQSRPGARGCCFCSCPGWRRGGAAGRLGCWRRRRQTR